MRLALFSDVHGNLTALQEVWREIESDAHFDAIVCAGDLAFSRPHPSECIEFLVAHEVQCILGNTDTFFLGHPGPSPAVLQRLPFLAEQLQWSKDRLSVVDYQTLQSIPSTLRFSPGPSEQTLLVCHATPTDLWPVCPPDAPDKVWEETMGPFDAAAIAFGHVHVPAIRHIGKRLFVNVAHCGLGAAAHVGYTILTFEAGQWQAERRPVFHDPMIEREYARKIGFPGADADQADF